MLTLLTGGARAGKSSLAERLAARHGAPITVIATGEALDDEMTARIARHQADRPDDWSLIEEPLDLAEALRGTTGEATVIIDCLTLWVANLAHREEVGDDVVTRAEQAADIAVERPGLTFVVSNEVGDGIVPMNAMAREYRETLGRVNQVFARVADRSYLVVAGRVLPLTDPETIDV